MRIAECGLNADVCMNIETELHECKPTANPNKKRAGIGMPASLYLKEFGTVLFEAFGDIPYHVGSSLTQPTWRDVDVRVMLDKEQYTAMGFGDPKQPHENARWVAYSKAFSLLGQKMTGLPIDFQIQETETANADYPRENDHARSALFDHHMIRKESHG